MASCGRIEPENVEYGRHYIHDADVALDDGRLCLGVRRSDDERYLYQLIV